MEPSYRVKMAMASISTSKITSAEPRLDAGAGRERVKAEGVKEFVADGVEFAVVALDIADVASRADDVMPGGAFAGERPVRL